MNTETEIDFEKGNGLVPAIIQDHESNTVLMLGYMNREALRITRETGRVTFFSRSRQKLWTKGETSGNFLYVKDILLDCDQDTILIKASPTGPVCHTGNDTCFNEINPTIHGSAHGFLYRLESVILDRKSNPRPGSYTASLFERGINRIAQKVGEEAVEVVIEAVSDNIPRLKEETADLLYHLLVLLAAKGLSLDVINEVLRERHSNPSP